jgi:hypothetical protein
MLDEGKNNFLACICAMKDCVGLCFADISTGSVHTTQFERKNCQKKVINELGRFLPSEIIINSDVLELTQVTDFVKSRLHSSCDLLDDVSFMPNGVTVDNLSELARSGARIAERRACEISELVDGAVAFSLDLLASGMGVYEILSLVAEGLTEVGEHNTDAGLALNLAHAEFLHAFDRAELADLYVRRLRAAGMMIDPTMLLLGGARDERVTYVKNPLADEAYDVLTQDFSEPRVSYVASFKEAADAVVSGEASYCLLPLEERGGTRLSPVSELMFRHDLKICRITPVFGFEGNADMKYALLSKGYAVPELSPGDDGYLEIRIRADEYGSLSELISVASYLGISVYRINTLTFDAEGEAYSFHDVVFRSAAGDFTSLLTYLTLFSSEFIPIGMYKNLE